MKCYCYIYIGELLSNTLYFRLSDFYMRTLLLNLLFAGAFIILGSPINLNAQVVINEICPSNISLVQNSNGDYDDWIELHNAGGSAVNLLGYGLTDDNTKPYRFTFPSYSLGAGKRILVFASDSNSSVLVNHWEMSVNALSSWKYIVGSAAVDTNWRNTSYSDGAWSSGTGGVGFGDSDDGTSIAVTTSVFMRKSFSIADTSQILKAVFMMDYDDGFVAYLNGVEIARANLGIIGTRPRWNDLAPGSHEAMMYQGGQPDSFYVDPVFLKTIIRPGTNVLTVETHNNTASSSDMSSIPYLFFGMLNSGVTYSNPPSWFRSPAVDYYNANFKLSRTGETVYLRNAGGTIIDQKGYASMDADNSYGRKPDGNSSWCYFGTPTPDASNNSSSCYTGYASSPVFSVSAGYYSSTRTISLSTSTPGGVIRYTTNGNIPTSSSTLYSSSIIVSSTKTIRARVFASGYLPSLTITNTYFINEDVDLPVFTITTDSLNLWDYNTGIYVLGPNAESTSPYKGANFWQPWQKPATVEYYDKQKNRVVRFDSEIEIFGNYSRAKAQKSFEIKLSDKFGTSEVDYPLIPDKSFITKYENIVLRNSGTDWNVTHFRDALMERIMKPTYSGYLAAEPAVMFLNGEFWGVYTIHEKHDNNWMAGNFGLKKSEIDYLRESGSSVQVEDGSDVTFWTMYNYATTQNTGTQQYYDYMNTVLDIRNYTDYFIAETYINNGDWIGEWTNNIKMWRPNAPGSKWRYLLYDTDFGFGLKGSVNDNRLSMARNPIEFSHSSEMFDAMLGNPTFKRYFINRYADLINTIYLPSNYNSVLHQFQDSMAADMPAHFAKWGSNMSTWQSNINSMTSFVNSRPTIMRDFIKSGFGLAGKVTLTLQVSPAGSGRIEISTITPTSYPWSGIYFNGNPVTITAIPNPGYSFDHWRSNVVISSNNYNQSATYNFTANDVITCYFTGSAATPKLTISEVNYNSDGANNSGDWIELYNYGTHTLNISGWKFSDEADNHVFQFPTGTSIAAGGYLVLVEDTTNFTLQYPSVTNKLGAMGFNLGNGGELVRVFDYQDNLYLSFTYQDQAPWPLSPDGGGYTLELLSPTGNLNLGTNWFAGCVGGSPGRAYSPLLATPVAVTGNTTFCNGGSVLLSATDNPGYAYQWKRNGSNLANGATSTYTADLAGTYTVSVTYQGCSVISDPTIVTVVSQGPDPVTTSTGRCGPGEITLIATSTDSIFWYDAPGGNLVGVGDTLVTPVLSSTTIYYSQSSSICPSNPVAATATILAITSTPATSDFTRCGPGIATLTATDTATIHWYGALIGGALLETGSTFVTNIIQNDSVFYVEAGNVCPSPRVEVHVYINSTAEPLTADNHRCGSGVVALSATGSGTLSWYNSATGGSVLGTGSNFNTPSLAASDTFYVEANSGCPSSRVRCVAVVEPILSAPTASGISDCLPGSFDLTATSTGQVYWFDASSGGILLHTGSIFTTPVISSSTTYYVEAGDQCRSSRTAVQVVISAAPPVPLAPDVSRCGTGIVNLNATSPDQIYWYDAPTGGTLLQTGSSFSTPSISTTTTYYVEAGTANCRSSRIAVQAVVNLIPAVPIASDVSRCGTGSVTLTATSLETVYWYSAASGGALLTTGLTYTTPSLSSSTTYYLEAGDNCHSVRIAVQAIISATPAVPNGADVTRCGTGIVSLTATGSGTLRWYSAAIGGAVLGTGANFTTPSITVSTTYYVEADNGCVSPSRKAIQAIIDPIPAAPSSSNMSRCGTGTVSLSATGSGQLYWYSAATGGTLLFTGNPFTTPSISTSTNYYVETGNNCRSARTTVQAIINSIPAAPSASNASRCGSGTLTLTASATETIYWYDQLSGGTLLATGNTFTTPVISSTITYYLENGNNCRSNRISVQAIITSPPAAPTASDVSRCGTGTVNLSASSTGTISWYASATGGAPLGTGNFFTTPSISTTTTYYAETFSGCASATRTPVQAIINSVPAPPSVSNSSRCGIGTVDLTASSLEQIYWYSAATGGSLLIIGTSYTTPSISATTTYYVETGNVCRSSRIAVQAIVNAIPATPSTLSVTRCSQGTVTLSASSPETIYWYDQATGGILLSTGNTYTTPVISATVTYYIEAGNSCRSARVPVQAIIGIEPAPPSAADVSRCGAGTVLLTASSPEQIYWYSTASGGTPLFTGNSFTTPFISSTTTYYAEAGNNCRSLTRTAVQAIILGAPAAPVASSVSRCGTGSVTITATSPEQIYWYNAATGGNLLFTGSSFITPSLSSTTTYYVETGNTCRSSRVAVQAIIDPVPPAPNASDVSRCGTGSVTLTAGSAFQIRWYANSSGGTPLITGSTYNTPMLSATTTYYVEAGTTCISVRIPVQAIVSSAPATPALSDGTRCGSGSVSLSGSSPTRINWYDAAIGGNLLDTGAVFNTPGISVTTTFYADAGLGCNSARVSVIATIQDLPAPPLTTDSSRCGSGTVILSASSLEQIYWYDVFTGGSPVGTGTSFITPSISTSTTYYVETGDLCRSLRVAVNAVITPPASLPIANDVSRCGQGTVTLTASSPESLFWYEHATGGSLLGMGASFTTPSLSSNETYYVEAGDVCVSARVRVEAIITSPPSAPVLNDGERCGSGSVVLTGVSSQQINWYDSASAGNLLGTGTTFNTPAITTNTIFYADAGIGCNSSRVPVNAVILALPASPSVISDSACGSGVLTLGATSPEQIYWFDAAVGGTQVGTGTSFTTPSISATTVYFVEAGDQCRSIRRSVSAVIIPYSVFLIVENGSGCGTSTVTLTASSNDTVRWYDLATGGTLIGTGSTFTTPVLSATQTYYAIAGDRCPSQPIALIASIHPAPFVDLGPDTIFIQSGQSVTLNPGTGYVNYQWSTGDSTQTIIVNSTGSYVITVLDSNGCFASDVVMINVDVSTIEREIHASFHLYPNPVHETLTISWSSSGINKAYVHAYSVDGRLVMFQDALPLNGKYSEKLHVKNFAPGIYLLRITDRNAAYTTRFVVE